MVKLPGVGVFLLFISLPAATYAPMLGAVAEVPLTAGEDARTAGLFLEIGLLGQLHEDSFVQAYERARGIDPGVRMLAIADMTRPSTEKRLFIIDLERKELVLRTWVAHGQGSGELMATRFSNRHHSHQTSPGLYRVGAEITSPKHGPALLLHGLDKGVNCQALPREVIVHGADYVSEAFIAAHGRLGRSWGCPAVPRADMARVIDLLADGGLLYVHAG